MPEELENKELEKSYWFLTHFEKFRSAGYGIGISIDVVIGLIVVGVGIYLAMNLYGDRDLVNQVRASLVHEEKSLPVIPITVDQSGILLSGEGRSDAYAVLQNPNDMWWARGTAVFSVDGADIPEKFIIYPSQQKTVLRLGIKQTGTAVSVALSDVSWYKVNNKDRDHLGAVKQIITENVVFDEVKSLGIEAPRVSFTLKNNSAYSFWDVAVPVVVYSGAQVIALHEAHVSRLQSAESRHVEVQWSAAFGVPENSTITAEPRVDVIDESSYMR